MIFRGTVYRRSSADGPPQPGVAGEREVFEHNPQRVRRILNETGWERVFCGTLNLNPSLTFSPPARGDSADFVSSGLDAIL